MTALSGMLLGTVDEVPISPRGPTMASFMIASRVLLVIFCKAIPISANASLLYAGVYAVGKTGDSLMMPRRNSVDEHVWNVLFGRVPPQTGFSLEDITGNAF